MQKIGIEILQKTGDMIADLFGEHAHEINQAYINTEDALSVAIGAKYTPNAKTGAVDIDVSLSFTLEKIKDTRKDSVNEGQGKLYELRDSIRKGEVSVKVNGEEIKPEVDTLKE